MKALKKLLRNIAFILIIIIGAVIIFKDRSPETSSSKSPVSTSNDFLAYNVAIDFVKQGLKSPSTAKFPKTMERSGHIKSLGGGRYEINSWVDSQNAFGAMIRTNFSCTMIDKGGNTWGCENLKFDE